MSLSLHPIHSALAHDPIVGALLPSFVTRAVADADGAWRALARGDMGAVRAAAHKLRGAGACYGFDVITDAASMLEVSLDERRAIEEVVELTARLRRVCRRARPGARDDVRTGS